LTYCNLIENKKRKSFTMWTADKGERPPLFALFLIELAEDLDPREEILFRLSWTRRRGRINFKLRLLERGRSHESELHTISGM
jgi:hypothetical protein